ncbi:MAG: hypothetical protein WCG99_04795, partial [Candidatus Berkelbacteria bacterium]
NTMSKIGASVAKVLKRLQTYIKKRLASQGRAGALVFGAGCGIGGLNGAGTCITVSGASHGIWGKPVPLSMMITCG